LPKTFPLDGDRLQFTQQLIDGDHRLRAAAAVLIARVGTRHGDERLIGAVNQRAVWLKERTEVK